MTLKEPHYLTEQGYKNLIKLQVRYEKIVEENKQLQCTLNAANTAAAANLNLQQMQEEECKRYKQALYEIEKVLKKHQCKDCDTEIFDCKYCDAKKISDIINKAKE